MTKGVIKSVEKVKKVCLELMFESIRIRAVHKKHKDFM